MWLLLYIYLFYFIFFQIIRQVIHEEFLTFPYEYIDHRKGKNVIIKNKVKSKEADKEVEAIGTRTI